MPCPEKVTVKTYLTPEEYDFLKKMAQNAKLSVSAYIKALCLGHEVKSKEDKTAIMELAKISADLGRLGGLFKLALSEKSIDQLRGNSIMDDIIRTSRLLETAALPSEWPSTGVQINKIWCAA